ncbi:hypothetical protein PIB30_004487 [Stylosanthes scabra]|uniref:DUF4216 domain-containing protein n=1 Tax=Stylosanthes scabra TaxID=79078 RepID=A0ABU6X262_9FABA|nr:hypothetical protein [Stylosanthes scabra]
MASPTKEAPTQPDQRSSTQWYCKGTTRFSAIHSTLLLQPLQPPLLPLSPPRAIVLAIVKLLDRASSLDPLHFAVATIATIAASGAAAARHCPCCRKLKLLDRASSSDPFHASHLLLHRRFHSGSFTPGEREEHEPYIEASQAQMVYYVDDIVNKGWSIAVHLKPRDLYDMGQGNEDVVYENQEQELEQLFDPSNEFIQLATNLLDSDVAEDNVATDLAIDMLE